MQIDKNVHDVERLFVQVDKAILHFVGQTSLHCPSGCATCCHGQKVSAAPLEFLPYAYSLYKLGLLEHQYWELKTSSIEGCFIIDRVNGRCSHYETRGLICRLFGNAAMVNREGHKAFSACRILKDQVSTLPTFDSILQNSAPVYSDFYMRLRNIDTTYGSMMIPVNQAILKAMEIVYYNTRRKRKHSV
ncbi:MAG TPA: YkgJ family cysteine cluster protein [Prolixibacteraceae bacterium]|nr:YkgJ family cysteine cluster protein [Prolixibacteraceae bacterium]